MIKTYQKKDPVELEEVLEEARRLAKTGEVLSIEHNMISTDVRDPVSGWGLTKSVSGYQIVIDTTGEVTGKLPTPRDILALCPKH